MGSPSPNPISIADAARQLGRSPATVRRWIADGAPTVELGKEGRGNGSLVDVDALRRWRAGASANVCTNEAATLQRLAVALEDVFKRDGGLGQLAQPAHLTLGMRDHQAAAFLWVIFERCARTWTGAVPEPLPPEIQNLAALVTQTARK